MSRAFKCDVCGDVLEGEPTGSLTLVACPGNYYFTNFHVDERKGEDICSGCVKSLSMFIRQLRAQASEVAK